MASPTKSKIVRLGPWDVTVTMRADRAEAVKRSLPYRTLVGPALTALDRASSRFAPAPKSSQLPPGVRDTPTARQIWGRVSAVEWYHSIDLGHGIVTPGKFDHHPIVDRYRLPQSLTGSRCLDVATFDGFWAFEMERRGAKEVVAIDLERWSDLDVPAQVREAMLREGTDGYCGQGFMVAGDILASTVRRQILNVYDLSQERAGGSFDFVFCGDLLLHLMNPARALQAIRSVTAGELRLVDVFDPELDNVSDQPLMRYCGGWVLCHWWMPSLRCLLQMVKDAGFQQVEVLDKFQVAERSGDPLWRAVIRATP